jgi:hypothetical protein
MQLQGASRFVFNGKMCISLLSFLSCSVVTVIVFFICKVICTFVSFNDDAILISFKNRHMTWLSLCKNCKYKKVGTSQKLLAWGCNSTFNQKKISYFFRFKIQNSRQDNRHVEYMTFPRHITSHMIWDHRTLLILYTYKITLLCCREWRRRVEKWRNEWVVYIHIYNLHLTQAFSLEKLSRKSLFKWNSRYFISTELCIPFCIKLLEIRLHLVKTYTFLIHMNQDILWLDILTEMYTYINT